MEDFAKMLQDLGPWQFLIVGYGITVAVEAPILFFGLSRQHPPSRRLFAGLWLTACSYPLVVLVVPEMFDPREERLLYLLVAESIAHFGECVLFYLAFGPLKQFWRDMIVVFAANLASFGLGELLYWWALTGADAAVS